MIKEICILKPPHWLDTAGFNKGKYYDRQKVGIFLDINDTIKVR